MFITINNYTDHGRQKTRLNSILSFWRCKKSFEHGKNPLFSSLRSEMSSVIDHKMTKYGESCSNFEHFKKTP